MRTGAFDVAIGQKPIRFSGSKNCRLVPSDDVPSFPMLAEDVPGDLAVIVGERGGEQVEGDPELLPVTEYLGVVPVDDLLRSHPLLSALTMIGVPWVSDPDTISTLLPAIR